MSWMMLVVIINMQKKRVELANEHLIFEKQHRQFLVQKQQLILNELKRRHQALDIKA